ncbi:UDP-3-O-acylglucosamine N-acyltransferase [Phycisphaerae bacterium RAS1]|nr:UDP-3-O-acylglucosamine N-acyltransferase [Phycisphaerae bacterium RAS1]
MSAPAQMTAAELARRLDGTLSGDGARVVRRVATLAEAADDCVAWLGDEKYVPQLAATRAGVVLVPAALREAPAGLTTIRVSDPDLALCSVLIWLSPPVDQVALGIHPTAIVTSGARVEGAAIGANAWIGPGVTIGAGTQIHPGVYLGSEVQVGRDCVLWPNVVVRERCRLGDRVIIHANSTIGADGFGYLPRGGRQHKIPQVGIVVIEDDVEIGANTCVDRAKSGVTLIARGVKIDNLVQVAHNVTIGEDTVIAAQCGVAGSSSLGRSVVLSGQVGLVDHIRVDDGVIVAAQSGVFGNLAGAGRVFRGHPAVEHMVFARQHVSLKRLPEMMDQLKDLIARVKRLESAADDSTRS